MAANQNLPSSIPLSEIFLGVVCPMANEGLGGLRFARDVLAQCTGFRTVRFFAVLDRVTTDNTREILDELAASDPRFQVVWAPENSCIVDAYVRGYRESLQAGADWILEIDAGFSHQPEDIPKLIAKMQEGYDCVFGSRFMPGGEIGNSSLKRYFVSRGGGLLANLLLRTRLTDMTSGFEVFSRSTLEMILKRGIQSRAHFFQTEIKAYCHHLRCAEAPIRYRFASPRLASSAVTESFRQLWRLYQLHRAGQL
jgi:dolichol-phosphate mannosyltransferase